MSITDRKIISNNMILEFSDDRIEAALTIEDHGFNVIPDFNYIMDFIKKNNITTSILEDEIKKMLEEKIFNIPVCIARGKKCTPSVNGEIVYLFRDITKASDPDPDEQVDHRERSRIKTVSKGDKVAKVIPPVQGEDGFTVTGEIISAGKAVEKKLPSGKNVAPDQNDTTLLIATENGSVNIISETKIDIEPVLNIPGNVDYSVGNLDFTGSIVVKGDIISGFTVKVTGSIQVNGVIEDAEIYAGGDVYALGCAGGGKGSVSAGGSVSIKYAENSRIRAGKDINVDEYLINCNVHADGSVYVKKKKGHIIGGETTAFHAVEANHIGNPEETRTVISAGFSSELKQQFALIDEEQTRNLKSLGDINSALKKINRFTMIKKQIPEDMKIQIKNLIKMKNIIEEDISAVLDRHIEAIKRLSQTETAAVRVYGTLYPGVMINFPDKQLANKEPISGVILKIMDDAIIITPANKGEQ
jgi:hypothetical protein